MDSVVQTAFEELRKKNHNEIVIIKTRTKCSLEVVNEAPYYTLTGIDQVFSIHLDVFWRVVLDSSVIFTSEDDYQKFGLEQPFRILEGFKQHFLGKYLVGIEFRRPVSDLVFHFEKGLKIEVFVSSGGYEGWSLHGGSFSLISLGGGKIGFFDRTGKSV